MSSASTNVNRSTDAADYLNWLKLYAQSNQLAGTGGTNLQPMYLIGLGNTMDITDSVTTDPHKQSLANTEDITDSITNLALNSGTFQFDGDFFCGHGYVPKTWYGTGKSAGDFDDSAPGGFNEPANPLRFSFGDFG